MNASIESQIDLGWESYYARNNWHLDLSLGYELQVFFNQNLMFIGFFY
ncbi:MAG: hypothetical protein JXA94_03375 [Parachlamydiales bacterium]|nr:hypothetical protein [Parachlamydiales bacterium]